MCCFIPGGFSSADWNVRLHVGAPTTTVSAAGVSGAGSIPAATTATVESMGLAAAVDDADGGGAGSAETIAKSTGLIATRRQKGVLDNRDLCRIISSFIPEWIY